MTATTYDDGDRVATVSDPLTRKTHFVYCTTATNCAANQVKTEYRAWVSGTACSQAPPSLQECYRRVTYFPDGEQQTIKDANGNTTTYAYDGFVRLTKTTFPDTTFEQLVLDENANVTQRTNRAGQNLTYQYNALNWVTQKVSPSPADTTSWTYLLDGQLDLLNDTLGNALNYKFDTAGRVTSLATKVPGLTNRNVSYVLDDNGNRTKLTWPVTDGSYFAGYCYDNLNRMTAVMENSTDSGCATNLLASYQYDTLSRRQQVTYGNSASMAYTYTNASDLQTLNHDMTGTSNDPHYTFTYTNAHELLTEANSDADYVWQPAANASTSYTPNNLNQYTAIGTQTTGGTSCSGAAQGLSYDCNGNLTYDGNLTYGYDAENRLMTASKTGLAASYQYDPLGRRTRKSGTGVTNTFYLSDGTDEIAEYDGTTGTLTTRYIPGPAIDEPIAMVDGATGTKTYFHTNHQGSVIAMSGSGAALTEGPYTYDPYGNCFLGATQTPCTSSGEPYRFTGRRFDPETGLLYYRARYYDSQKGRFLQTDPVGYSADLNLYTYVGNDPTDKTDPTGEVIDVTRTTAQNADGTTTTTVNISVTAELIVDGGHLPAGQTATSFANSIANSIKRDFSGTYTDKQGNVTKYVTNVDMKVGKVTAPHDQLRHDFVLVANGDKRIGPLLGNSPGFEHGRTAFINETAGNRTPPHELGHLAGLRHPSDPHNPIGGLPVQNLMSQTRYSNSQHLEEDQLRSISNNPEFN